MSTIPDFSTVCPNTVCFSEIAKDLKLQFGDGIFETREQYQQFIEGMNNPNHPEKSEELVEHIQNQGFTPLSLDSRIFVKEGTQNPFSITQIWNVEEDCKEEAFVDDLKERVIVKISQEPRKEDERRFGGHSSQKESWGSYSHNWNNVLRVFYGRKIAEDLTAERNELFRVVKEALLERTQNHKVPEYKRYHVVSKKENLQHCMEIENKIADWIPAKQQIFFTRLAEFIQRYGLIDAHFANFGMHKTETVTIGNESFPVFYLVDAEPFARMTEKQDKPPQGFLGDFGKKNRFNHNEAALAGLNCLYHRVTLNMPRAPEETTYNSLFETSCGSSAPRPFDPSILGILRKKIEETKKALQEERKSRWKSLCEIVSRCFRCACTRSKQEESIPLLEGVDQKSS